MNFNSLPFLAFILVVMLAWDRFRARPTSRWLFLCTASLVFYGWWDWRFVFLLLGSGTVDFLAALGMEKWPARRRFLLVASLGVNIGALVFFKYLSFAAMQLRELLGVADAEWGWTDSIVLPIGISFYTFQSMSYTIDCYRGRLRATRNPLHFLSYLSMFPQLVAGPIVRATDLIPQLATPGHFNRSNRLSGLGQVACGFFKKTVIADNLAPAVNDLFAIGNHSGDALVWWVAAGLFAIQIFADFSGYSDIACGIARWLGYRFPENFRQPYLATSFRDFWSRWHITLSTWFRDYVYIPLGGSRASAPRTSVNLMFTMLVSGLWHGANWTFLVWGGLHGTFLLVERLIPRFPANGGVPVAALRWAVVMAGVLVGWAVFRAENLEQAWTIVSTMFMGEWRLDGVLPVLDAPARLGLLAATILVGTWAIRRFRAGEPSIPVRVIVIAIALLAAVFLRGPGNDFIYFQF